MKLVLMIGDIRLLEESHGVAGDVYVFDAAIATPQNFAAHVAKFTPTLIKKFLVCVQVGVILNVIPMEYTSYSEATEYDVYSMTYKIWTMDMEGAQGAQTLMVA